jgi:carboxylate-amine ligase
LILDEELKGRASDQTRVYELGQVAFKGVQAETVLERANEVLDRAPDALSPWGFDCDSSMNSDIVSRRAIFLPTRSRARFERERSIPDTLRHLCELR